MAIPKIPSDSIHHLHHDYLDSDSDSDPDSSSAGSIRHTSYILAFDDGQIVKKSDLSNPTISRIGGRPVFLPLENTKIEESDFSCLICHEPMPMIVQIYCVSEKRPYHDRVLYLFGCMNKSCQAESSSKCVRAFKSSKFNLAFYEENPPEQVGIPTGVANATSFDENPFKMGASTMNFLDRSLDHLFLGDCAPEASMSAKNPFSSPALTLKSCPSTQPQNTNLCAAWPLICDRPRYLTTAYEIKPSKAFNTQAFDETISSSQKTKQSSGCPQRNNQIKRPAKKSVDKSNASSGEYCESEKYEVQVLKGIDPMLLTFQDRLSWEGQSNQLIRYNPKGRPMLLNSNIASSESLKCGHKLQFELQIMPAALVLFSNPPYWATAWVSDCEEDCPSTDESWIEVQAFVQFSE
ncbi:hypothetical protein O181_023791 [Austropuccinia psidii MF-1]|uniref:Programmed cell death protein 2 C-terminal domain-containing protein n=1 Tax=Austropuccinia psidii MF-1 TaxID=1389203 RepID=A0A9Q3GY00_9BASI|nr:hypothetical protein [Austropuccinia psidii MF-1]